MNALKVCVETAVRPVWASDRRKYAMRAELYAHLLDIHQQEQGRLVDEDAAVEAAIRRFGDPAELRRELQQTVPRLERVLCCRVPGLQWLDSTSQLVYRRRRSGESVERRAVRNVALGMLGWAVVLALAVGVLGYVRWRQHSAYPAFAELRILMVCAMFGVLALASYLLPGAVLGVSGAADRRPRDRSAKLRAAVFSVALSLALFGAALPLLLMLKRNGLYADWHLYALVLCALCLPPVFAVFLGRVAKDAQRYEEWGCLDIAE